MTVRVYAPVMPSVEVFGAYEGVATATAVNQKVSLTFTPTEGNLTIVPYGNDGDVSQLQLEVGSTPSSYIPTSGSTVTRAADTLTVPSANLPWPTPNVIGEELVTNGTFDTDTSGWAEYFGTISYNSGAIELTNGTSTICRATQALTTVIGRAYTVTCDTLPGGTATTALLGVSNNADLSSGINVDTGSFGDSLSLTFVATATTTYVGVTNYNTTTGITGLFDNISVREIDPLAVSIQMEGRMTYADEDQDAQEVLLLWGSGGNRIRQALTTNLGTGRIDFQSAANSVFDFVVTDGSYLSPGVNVPFNIASRHGSTFVNGAVDGTALTEDTTPTALPDLSATDLSLAYSGGPMILKKVRIWNEDIGDAGIAEAST